MANGIHLELTLTIGDVIVAGSTVLAITSAYFAMKGRLAELGIFQKSIVERVTKNEARIDEHGEKLEIHGNQLVALEGQVFGRRRSDHGVRE